MLILIKYLYFCSMNVIKLRTIDSTNRYLKELVHSETFLPNFLTVWTLQQTAGVGQYGAKWQTEPYQNLTFSTLFIPEKLLLQHAFLLNMSVSIAVVRAVEDVFREYSLAEEFYIKWPNDILIGNKKVGGILIENILQGQQITKSVIGIGLNVNQIEFEGLPKASSLKNIIKKNLDIEQLMKLIISNLEKELTVIEKFSFEEIYNEYRNYLFRLEKVSTFRSPEGIHFMGIIKGVTSIGELIVATEEAIKNFSLKQIELLY